LKRGSTVADVIEGWISVSGAENFGFAAPVTGGAIRLLPFGDAVLSAPSRVERARMQGGVPNMTQNQTSDLRPAVIELSNVQPAGAELVAQTMAVGDPVLSLRTLVKRPSEAAWIDKIAKDSYLVINPFMNLNFTGETFESDTYLQRVRALYRFSTGGVRVHIMGLGNGTGFMKAKLVDLSDGQLFKKPTATCGAGGVFVMADATAGAVSRGMSLLTGFCDSGVREDLTGVISFEVPYYHFFEKIDNMQVWANGGAKKMGFSAQLACPLALVIGVDHDATNVSVQVSAADDFNAGWLSGPPITFER